MFPSPMAPTLTAGPLPVLLGIAALAGCTVGPDYQRPPVAVPATHRGAAATAESTADTPWRGVFRDPVLRDLIDEALRNNQDLAQATHRIEEARAALGAARSEAFPWVEGSAAASRTRRPEPLPGINPHVDEFDLLAGLSWEIDLWGRIRRSTEAARATLLATDYGRATVETTLVASVASSYADLRTYDRQLEISRQTVESRKKSLALVQERAKQGVASDLEVGQAEVLLRQAEVKVPQAEQAIGVTENAICVLLGRHPGPVARGRVLENLDTSLRLKAGMPSRLLETRPDLLAAEQEMVAANANIGVAKAAYFPALSLTGRGGLISSDIDDLLKDTAKTWTLAPEVTAPIFNAGRIGFGVKAAEARQKQALAAYLGAIQNAFREASDAIITFDKAGEVVGKQEALVAALARVASLAATRYEGGASSYLEVLDAERNLFDGQLALTEARRSRILAAVKTYRALGGGWDIH